MPYVHGTPSCPGIVDACDTVKVWPAMVAVPVRASPGLRAIVRATAPPPEPLAPAATEIHPAFPTADHAHPLSALTWIVMLPPLAGTDWPDESSEYRHGAASCEIATC